MAPYLEDSNPVDGIQQAKLLQVECSGTPHEIGFTHGKEAAVQVSRTIKFYAGLFQEKAKMDWTKVQHTAMTFEPVIRRNWPDYIEEMRGLADGAGVGLADIVACNIRTEIAFGMFSDGCTALSWCTDNASFLAQNWDWMEDQKENLIILTINQTSKPTIKMVTEAGLIGKIGLNSAGVGVCLNAIQAKGMDPTKLPCHLGLRMVLDSETRAEAEQRLQEHGIASSCHMLVADGTGAVGLEWSAVGVARCAMNSQHQIFHTNHYLENQYDGEDATWLEDSSYRVTRVEELCREIQGQPTKANLFEVFKDEANFPGCICRTQKGSSTAASLFNIIMDLRSRSANVTLGRPVAPEDSVILSF